jgi:HAD superfamily hydrolase (TIGR01549 family)
MWGIAITSISDCVTNKDVESIVVHRLPSRVGLRTGTMLESTWLTTTQTWVFDLDGTLTVPKHDFGELRRRLGLGGHEDILSVFEDVSPKRVLELKEVIANWEWAQVPQTQAAPGAQKLLECLSERHCKIAILTRNLREIALATLDEIGCRHYFRDALILGREDAPAKPAPDGVLKCLELMNAGGAAIMVGDYVYDVQAGRAAGCRTILTAAELTPEWASHVDLFVTSLTEVCAAIA